MKSLSALLIGSLWNLREKKNTFTLITICPALFIHFQMQIEIVVNWKLTIGIINGEPSVRPAYLRLGSFKCCWTIQTIGNILEPFFHFTFRSHARKQHSCVSSAGDSQLGWGLVRYIQRIKYTLQQWCLNNNEAEKL